MYILFTITNNNNIPIFQLWTAEEQLRLEELLIEYPAGQNENSRWKKIAEALGKLFKKMSLIF